MVICSLVLLLLRFGFTTALGLTTQPENVPLKEHVAIDLGDSNFTSSLLLQQPRQTAVMMFYASWCPHCHHYAPTFERAARFLNAVKGTNAVFVGRVDCATEVKTCGKYDIPGYPHLVIGYISDFVMTNKTNLSHHNQLAPEELVRQINKLLPESALPKQYRFRTQLRNIQAQWGRVKQRIKARVMEQETLCMSVAVICRPLLYREVSTNSQLSNVSHVAAPAQETTSALTTDPIWTLQDVESATRMLWHMIITTPSMHTGPGQRVALLALLKWWAVSHPSQACMEGAKAIIASYESMYWPALKDATSASEALLGIEVCGKGTWKEMSDSWISCKSGTHGARGFTCGLWLLFHTSAARLHDSTEPEPAKIMVAALRGFATYFFLCEVCQKHFNQVVSRPEVDHLSSQRDAVMWLWRVHNEVNARLQHIEVKYGHSHSGDPDHPKIQWPAVMECGPCHSMSGNMPSTGGGQWSEDAVYSYLDRVYNVASADANIKAVGHLNAQGTLQTALGRRAGPDRPHSVSWFNVVVVIIAVVCCAALALLVRQAIATACSALPKTWWSMLTHDGTKSSTPFSYHAPSRRAVGKVVGIMNSHISRSAGQIRNNYGHDSYNSNGNVTSRNRPNN